MAEFRINVPVTTVEPAVTVDAGLPIGRLRFRLEVIDSAGHRSAPHEAIIEVQRLASPGPIVVTPGPVVVNPGPIVVNPGPIVVNPGPIVPTPGPVRPPVITPVPTRPTGTPIVRTPAPTRRRRRKDQS